MRFPQYGREVLRGASDGGHGKGLLLLIVGVVEVILALPEVNDLHLVVTQKEQIGRLDVPMADALALQEGTGRDETAVHPHQFRLGPEEVGLLPLAVEGLQIGGLVHEFSDNADFEGVVARLAQKIGIILDDIGMVLHLPQLLRLLLILVQLFKGLGLDLLEGEVLAGWDMDRLVDLGVLLAGAQHVQLLEVRFLEHC